MKSPRNKCFIFTFSLLMISCSGTNDVYNTFLHLPKNGWYKRDVQRFTPEITDTVSHYDIYLGLRHNDNFDYRNLWLFVTYSSEYGRLKTDTVNCELADEFGRWSGSGWGSLYQHEIKLKGNVKYGRSGKKIITVQQAMRDDMVQGVADIGIRIVKRP